MAQNRNPNLQAAGEMLISFAATLRKISIYAAGLGAISLVWGLSKMGGGMYDHSAGLGLVFVGIGLFAIALFIWVASIFMGAMGEALLSLVSIEANICNINETIQTIAEVRPAAVAVPSHKLCAKCLALVDIESTFCDNCGWDKFQAQ